MHGQGTATSTNGDQYVGEYKDDKAWEVTGYDKDGNVVGTVAEGVTKWIEPIDHWGGTYTGEVKDGVPHGQGTLKVPDKGVSIVGGWKDGVPHGQVTATFPGGHYVGGNKDGKMHGQGTLTQPDGSKYVGEFKLGNYHGQGTMTWPDGHKYVGEWKDDKKHGQGTMTWADGTKYVGEWKNGNYHGQGAVTLANGEQYVGEWEDDKYHGQGTYTWPDGEKYVGEFKDGKMHGQGTRTWADGRKYVGEWKDDRRHGQGTYTFPNGEKFIGEFRNNYHWQGTGYNPSGEVIGKKSDGMWAPTACGEITSKGFWGTGFAVNQDHVVTNAHVLDCCKKVVVLDLSCSNRQEATVVSTEQRSDLGLLRLDRSLDVYRMMHAGKDYATLRNAKELQLGEAVLTYDRKPKGNNCPQYAVGQGKVTKVNWMPDDSRIMVHDSPISEGSSGGPVLDAFGHLVGVTQRSVGYGAGATKSYLLKTFLKSNNVEYTTATSTKTLSLTEIKKKSDKYTVMILCVR